MVERALHTTVALAVPGLVLVPVIQVQVTRPEALAVLVPSPLDPLCQPLGRVTDRLHLARGTARATRLA